MFWSSPWILGDDPLSGALLAEAPFPPELSLHPAAFPLCCEDAFYFVHSHSPVLGIISLTMVFVFRMSWPALTPEAFSLAPLAASEFLVLH